jgi:N-acetylated-alpha-linked acidic dipeptidase
MERFGDPDFERHALSSRLTAVMALRLANALVLPYDYGRFGEELAAVATELATVEERTQVERRALRDLSDAFQRLRAAGETLDAARLRALEAELPPERAREANESLLRVERAMTRDEGLEGRPWYRNLIFASDYRNGYATIALPSVQEAIRAGEEERVVAESLDLAERVDRAVQHVLAAAGSLR